MVELQRNELKFCVDEMEEPDIDAISRVLPKFLHLNRIDIWGKHFKDFIGEITKEALGGTLPS
jgi:hypothetical protein